MPEEIIILGIEMIDLGMKEVIGGEVEEEVEEVEGVEDLEVVEEVINNQEGQEMIEEEVIHM